MQIKVTKEDFTKERVMDLFETATYGSSYLEISCEKPLHEYEFGCDKAYWKLIEGGEVVFTDYYAEGVNSRVCAAPYINEIEYDPEDEYGPVRFHMNLDQIVDSLNYAIEHDDPYLAKCVIKWHNEDNDFDSVVADAIVQGIMFGEVVYG